MCDGVRETLCVRCVRREVCTYKDAYLSYLKTLMKFNNEYSDDISFVKKDDPQRAIDTIVEAFEKLAVKFKEMADTLNKAFGFSVSEEEKKQSLSSPARYGMSLKKIRRESFIKQYSYRPITQKHLPYQRRNY